MVDDIQTKDQVYTFSRETQDFILLNLTLNKNDVNFYEKKRIKDEYNDCSKQNTTRV